jgi:hypothetical protein
MIKCLLRHNYRDQLRANLLLRIDSLEVELRHVALYNDDLAHAIQDRPGDTLPLFELAAAKAAKKILYPIAAAAGEDGENESREVQIMIKSTMNMLQFRDLTVRPSLHPQDLQVTDCLFSVGRYVHEIGEDPGYCHINFNPPIPRDETPPQVSFLWLYQGHARSTRTRWCWRRF